MRTWALVCCLLIVSCWAAVCERAVAADVAERTNQLFTDTCSACHNGDDPKGGVAFSADNSIAALRERPDLLQRVLLAIDAGAMPPEPEAPLPTEVRETAVQHLRSVLMEAAAQTSSPHLAPSRLNRFQYNNAVRDLFQLNRDAFALSEKLMTRYDDYLTAKPVEDAGDQRMPGVVHVASHSLAPLPGLADVKPFPKDLRAEHGFDNQVSQLTLSPLLLDAFLRLSVSIVESPDFNEQTVGIWNDFFASPASADEVPTEVRRRLARFLRLAFRGQLDDETLQRYCSYTQSRLDQGMAFPDAMTKTASAALSSPLFLLRAVPESSGSDQLTLASRLSWFLWGSCPDDELLSLAEQGRLSEPEVFDATVRRMMADRRIERFLDAFPAQWMQLENALAVTPDPAINRYFSLLPEQPASVQMIPEPLLLFDAIFVENRPLVEFLSPEFSYRSDFLQAWYLEHLEPPSVNVAEIQASNARIRAQRTDLSARLAETQQQLNELLAPVRQRLLQERGSPIGGVSSPDLQPVAAWDFEGDLKDSVGDLDLEAKGDIAFLNGRVVLKKSFLLSHPLAEDLTAKSLEVRFLLRNPDQNGGGLMGIQGAGDFFDTIVIGERKN
ncbi:MAG: DUF1592 domain-containing protein, partial [Planctomycetaceae bacterium]|nr:DUF1592 domain-containing protein [Planctomycetaceae bacterium]